MKTRHRPISNHWASSESSRVLPVQHPRGITKVEVIAVITVVLVGVVVWFALRWRTEMRESVGQWQDAAMARSIHQAMVIWAGSNKNHYPLPSEFDRSDFTVADKGRAKDTSANIISILIFNGNITPETCRSFNESNPNIKVHANYQTNRPPTAVDPTKALWDPAFSADFADGKVSNLSFAHMLPSDGRLDHYKDTMKADEAVVANRGPEITGMTDADGAVVSPTFANGDSTRFHQFTISSKASRGYWSGNVVYNDNHVDFVKNYLAPGKRTTATEFFYDKSGNKRPDLLFYDEPDDPLSSNNFLGIFIKAGDTTAAFKAIWD